MTDFGICVLLIGPPGCGKTTIANFLHRRRRFQLLQPGQMLRRESAKGTLLGEFIKHNWNHETLTPLSVNMMQRKMRQMDSSKPLVIDGHPRNMDEIETLGDVTQGRIVCVLAFENVDDLAWQRSKKRKRDGETNIESMKIRFDTFMANRPAIHQKLHDMRVLYRMDARIDIETLFEQCEKSISDAWKARTILLPANLHIAEDFVEPIEEACALQTMISSVPTKRPWKHFSGRHAVSLQRHQLTWLWDHEYLVSVKIDGERVFLVTLRDKLYMINRALKVKQVLCNHREVIKNMGTTIIDAEWLEKERIFVIIDIVMYRNTSLVNYMLMQRMRPAEQICIELASEQYRFFPQKYLAIENIDQVRIEQFKQKQDGFIFTPVKDKYIEGTDSHLLKWKYEDDNTVDFLYKDQKFWTIDRHRLVIFTDAHFIEEWMKEGDIVECFWDKKDSCWKAKRIRSDKTRPNPLHIVQNIVQSIRDPVTFKILRETPIHLPKKSNL